MNLRIFELNLGRFYELGVEGFFDRGVLFGVEGVVEVFLKIE